MPKAMIEAYLERLPARKAEQALLMIQATAFPNMKPKEQEKLIKQLGDTAQGLQRETVRPPTEDELATIGIGVRYL